MPWSCRLVDIKKLQKNGDLPRTGDMWFAPWMDHHSDLSPEYKRNWRNKRPPIFVKLPNGRIWCVDFISSGKDYGWIITGFPPKITAYPSVGYPGSNGYHGLLVCGFLCDDMEGRKY